MATVKAAPAKKVTKTGGIQCYIMKTKQKEEISNVTIAITKGKYIVSGTTEDGNKGVVIANKEKAEQYVADGLASWAEDEKPAKKIAKK